MAVRPLPVGVRVAPAPAVIAVGVGVIVSASVVVIRVAGIPVAVIRPVSRPKVAGYDDIRLQHHNAAGQADGDSSRHRQQNNPPHSNHPLSSYLPKISLIYYTKLF